MEVAVMVLLLVLYSLVFGHLIVGTIKAHKKYLEEQRRMEELEKYRPRLNRRLVRYIHKKGGL